MSEIMKEKLSLKRDEIELYGLLEGPDPTGMQKGISSGDRFVGKTDAGQSAKNNKIPLAIIMHGFNTNSRQHPFYDLTRALWDKGIATLRFDFSYHGRSGGDMADLEVEHLDRDAEIFYEYARQLEFVGDIYLIGYSLGGIIASHLAAKYHEDIKKLVLLSPAADIRYRAECGFFFGNEYDPADPPEVMETAQFRIGKPYFLSALNVSVYEHLKQFGGEALLVYGEKDEYVPREMTLDYQNYLKNLTVVAAPEADHLWTADADIAVKAISDFLGE